MTDGIRAAEQVKVSRQEVYEGYVSCYRQCTDIQPCRDASLLRKAARYLREPETRETFTLFPFYQALSECHGAPRTQPRTDNRKLLSAFIKATEVLETVCVNLFLQPWKKEIKTLKTFTGPFVYCLLPVLSTSTIQSVLASIGYLPHTDAPQIEYRLSEDVNPDRAVMVGFELLLARVECYHLMGLLDKDQLEPKEWLEVLQRGVGPKKLEPPAEKKKTTEQNEEEEREDTVRKEVPPCLDTRLAVNPEPELPHCSQFISVDQSIMEMQMTYPDLAFRGRPLLPDKSHVANISRSSSSKAVHTASTHTHSGDSKAAEVDRRDLVKDTKAAAAVIQSKNDYDKAAEVFADDGRNVPGDSTATVCSNTDGSRGGDAVSHPKPISLHITLKAGSTAQLRLKPGEHLHTAERPALCQQQPAAENLTADITDLQSLSSTDEDQELRELAERMGQLHVKEDKEELKRKDNERGEQNINEKRRKKEKTPSTKGGAEELDLKRPVMETGAGLSHAATRSTRSSQSEAALMKEQKQPTVHKSLLPTVSAADCQSCNGGGTGQQEGDDTERAEAGRREVEQLTQSYVIVEHHKK